MIRVEQVERIYHRGGLETVGVQGVSFELPIGVMAGIFGRSGSGKSTLLRMLGAIDVPDSGKIWLDDQQINGLNETQKMTLRQHTISYVFQDYGLLPELTALENVALPGLVRGMPHLKKKASDLLASVGLPDRHKYLPKQLSTGQQQRVAIARALITEPQFIFADEPTANLDSINSRAIMDILLRLNHELGVTIVFVSDTEEDRRYADYILEIMDGRLISIGKQPDPRPSYSWSKLGRVT